MFRQTDSADRRGALRRRISDLLSSMTGVLQYIGFGGKASEVPPAPQSEYEIELEQPPELHDQADGDSAPRLERGHPKR